MIVVIGEILFDEFPNYRRLGGAPFNFAFHLKNFGFDVRFISRIGKDDAGREICQRLEISGFALDDIQTDNVHPTGRVNVLMDGDGTHQFDIITDVAYDFIEFRPEFHSELMRKARLIYFGTLVQRSETGHDNLQALISACPSGTLKFYDINLRPGCHSEAVIERSLRKTDILKLSTEELDYLKHVHSFKNNDDDFIRFLIDEYSLSTVSLTKGASGSELHSKQGGFSQNRTEAVEVVDAVGAGDAYAAMLAAGILKDWRPKDLVARAARFAARVCGIKGAIPDAPSFYEAFKPYF